MSCNQAMLLTLPIIILQIKHEMETIIMLIETLITIGYYKRSGWYLNVLISSAFIVK